MEQPKSSVVSLLKEMTAKFEEDPPLSSKAPADSQNPQDLLNFVTNLQINDGETHLINKSVIIWMYSSLSLACVYFRWEQTSGEKSEQSVSYWWRGFGNGFVDEHFIKGIITSYI